MSNSTQGWGFLANSRKWHYLKSGSNHTICGKFLVLGRPPLEEGNNNSPDNCTGCIRALEKLTSPPDAIALAKQAEEKRCLKKARQKAR